MPAWKRLARRAGYLLDPRVYLYLPERLLLLWPFHSDRPQLFILGLPRSGTTLVYQYAVHRLDVAYFTNGAGGCFLSPCLATWWQRRLHGEYRSDFRSHYGRVSGPLGPHEGGRFWGRFFDYEAYARFEDVSRRGARLLRRTVACVEMIYGGRPFVNKNVKHLLRVEALSRIFPQSVFLVVERETKHVALSVLRARHENLSDPSDWWSVRPPDYEALAGLPPVEQVAHQLDSLRRRLEADLAALPGRRVLRVHYERFCQNPESLVTALEELWGRFPYRNPPVERFAMTHNQPQTPEEERLVEVLANVAGR